MKKLFISLLLVLLLFGCGKKEEVKPNEPIDIEDNTTVEEQDERITNLAYEVLNKYGIDFAKINIDYVTIDGEISKDTVNIYVKKDIDVSDYYLSIANYIGSFATDKKVYSDSMHTKELTKADISDNTLIGYLTINEIEYEINIIYSKDEKFKDADYQAFKIGISEI